MEGGLGYGVGDHEHLAGLGRIRAGLLLVDSTDLASPVFWCVGVTGEISGIGRPVVGLQFEVLGMRTGAALQLGAGVDTGGEPAGMVALGWSLFAIEGQLRRSDVGLYGAGFLKIRLPLGAIIWAAK